MLDVRQKKILSHDFSTQKSLESLQQIFWFSVHFWTEISAETEKVKQTETEILARTDSKTETEISARTDSETLSFRSLMCILLSQLKQNHLLVCDKLVVKVKKKNNNNQNCKKDIL